MKQVQRARFPAVALAAVLGATPFLPATASAADGEPSGRAVARFSAQSHDFGRIGVGQAVRHSFPISNDGDVPLEIRNVFPTCGCTVVSYPKEIAAGASGQIEAVLQLDDYGGPIKAELEVETSDPEQASVTLHLAADIVEFIGVHPSRKLAIEVPHGEEGRAEFLLKGLDPTVELAIAKVASDHPKVNAKVEPVDPLGPEAGLGDIRVVVHLGRRMPIGPAMVNLQLTTNHPVHALLELAVDAVVVGPIRVTPPRLAYDSTKQIHLTHTVMLRSDEAFRILGAEADDERLDVTVDPTLAGRVVATWTDRALRGIRKGRLTIRTDHRLMGAIVVPYTVHFE